MVVPTSESSDPPHPTNGTIPHDTKGWDGKLRVDRRAVVTNAEILSDPEYSDEDAPPVEQINADEGGYVSAFSILSLTGNGADLLDDYEPDTEDIDLVHSRVSSIPALLLERFTKLEISHIEFPATLGLTLQELDLYDNLLAHIKGLDDLARLTSLDLSFNKIKHIKNVNHIKELRDLYFVQNKIQRIENLDGLTRLRNLELAANRIRNISHLSNLKILDVKSNRLPQISGLSNLPHLEELYISHNALTEISGLDENVNLRTLDISNNQITHLTNLGHLEHLEELWASSNLLLSFEEVERQLADKKELTTVYFEMNPLQLKNAALYRNKVKLALPQIQQIDATYVRVA
ncbi:protein phosphatase 1 regulatory subunit 7, partial [Lecanoromycetidae sp. Uapishka_2]